MSTIGHRAYLIERNGNTWEYHYSHWGASKILRLPDLQFHSEEEIDMETLEETFEELKEQGEKSGEAASLNDIIDVSDIVMELYVIKDGSQFHLVQTFINGDIHGAAASEINEIYDIHCLKGCHRTLSGFLRVETKQEDFDTQEVEDKIRKYCRGNRHVEERLILEDDKPRKVIPVRAQP